MSCYRPLKAWRTSSGVFFHEDRRHGDDLGIISIPCGMCIGCRAKRASDWAMRCMHEASLREDNCFVTLTYGAGALPPGSSLCHRDFQLFMKRLRRQSSSTIRFFMCGEYGPKNGRPHYHACLFGVDFRSDRVAAGKSTSGSVFYDSPALAGFWSHGRVSVQDLTIETAGYCSRYVMKKLLGPSARTPEAKRAREWTDTEGEVHERAAEYAAMSLKPGIGADWFSKYGSAVYAYNDFIIVEGQKQRPPKYYDKLCVKLDRQHFEDCVSLDRQDMAKLSYANNTDERLRDREIVHGARLVNQKRENDL